MKPINGLNKSMEFDIMVSSNLNLMEVYYEKNLAFWDTLFDVNVFMCLYEWK